MRPLLWQAPEVPENDGILPEGGPTGKDLF